MQNYSKSGDVITVTAPVGGVVSGVPVLIGAALFGIPAVTAAAGESFELLRKAQAPLPKAAALAITAGDQLYWDNTAKVLNKTASGNTLVAIAVLDALAADTTVEAVLLQ